MNKIDIADYPLHPTGDMRGYQPSDGINIRQYYAGLMMQAQIIHHGAKGDYAFNESEAAREAVSAADTLIAELSKGA